MLDIKEKRHITVVGRGGGSTSVDWDDIENKPEFATVATSGDYDDLTDKPELFSGDYNDLTNKPDLSHYVEDTDLATVATSGSYNDLSDKPTIPAAQVNSDWNASSGVQQILNKPTLATVATSGSYSDLSNTPSLATVATSGSYNDLSNTPSLATVATSGDYTDLSNKPDLSHYVEDTDLATVATSGSYNDLSDKPTIPTVPPMATETLTFTLDGGTTKTINFYVIPNYFYVEDISGSDNTLSITGSNSNPIEIFKSTDLSSWTSMGTTSSTAITATIPANSKLYIKATTTKYDNTHFSATGNHNVGGNSMSLLYGDSFDGKTTLPNSSFTFNGLFSGDTHLVNADKLELPAASITSYGYKNMFNGCTSLITAPVLPATHLNGNSYEGMFQNCTSLVTAPVLPTTNDTSGQCYKNMFNGCTSLNRMVVYATNQSFTSYCISNWLNNVAAQGDFYNLGGITYPSGASGIPEGWTEHTSL